MAAAGNSALSEAERSWEERALKESLERFPEERAEFVTDSGIPVDRIHTPAKKEHRYLKKVGFPGEYPFTRGIHPTMYRGRLWTMRQYSGYGTAAETNQRFRYLLDQGQSGLSVAFDLPTQMGYDPDHPLTEGEVGKAGVSIAALPDMETLLNGIPLDRVSTSMTINATAPILLTLYAAVARKRGIPLETLSGTVQNDILKEYVARGTYIYPPRASMRLVSDTIEYATREMPRWNPISISGYHMREAGATAVQEVAFTFANAIAYVEAALARGLEVDEFASRLSFFFVAQNDLLEEVAKFRAARRLWARIMRERFGAEKPRSWALRFHTQTAGSALTAQQPETNMARVAIQALSAVLGGTQSLHTNAMDEALALPSEKAATVALRTQQIIAHESGATNTPDPLAGSWYVEQLTDQIETRAGDYIKRIDGMGGAVAAIEAGFMRGEIDDASYRHQQQVEAGDRVIVGVNRYREKEALTPELLRVDPAARDQQIARLERLKAERETSAVEQAIGALKEAAESDQNLLSFILDAVEAQATLGEISDALRSVFGEHRPF